MRSILANGGRVPRQHRFLIPGLTQHVIQRGNNRCAIFREASDYEVFLLALREACAKHAVDIHAYALMTNHLHLMVTPQSATALPFAMQSIGRRYVQFFNRRYDRTGGLWEGRYRTSAIDDDRYWLHCMRYIELNPVRAGLATTPEAYQWSSYRTHALGAADVILVPHALYLGLGATAAERQSAWRTCCTLTDADVQGEVRRISEGERVPIPAETP